MHALRRRGHALRRRRGTHFNGVYMNKRSPNILPHAFLEHTLNTLNNTVNPASAQIPRGGRGRVGGGVCQPTNPLGGRPRGGLVDASTNQPPHHPPPPPHPTHTPTHPTRTHTHTHTRHMNKLPTGQHAKLPTWWVSTPVRWFTSTLQ